MGIPFAIYPSELYYQRGMFDEIGLTEPPHKYGEKYTVTGRCRGRVRRRRWHAGGLELRHGEHLAKLLTVDENNNDATQAGFDPTKIAQYGFEPQRDDLRGLGAFWGAGSLVAADGKTVQIPDAWAAAWKWFYNGIWTDHIIMDGSHFNDQTVWNPDGVPFCNGKIAMAENFLWSTYCLTGAGDNWDIAAIPAYNGTQTAAFNADTFRIWKDTKNPDAAFTVLTYLLGDASGELTQIYGAMPAREDGRQAFFDTLTADANAPEADRLAGCHRRHRPCRHPQLRVAAARVQRDPQHADHVPQPVGYVRHGWDMDAQISGSDQMSRSADHLEQGSTNKPIDHQMQSDDTARPGLAPKRRRLTPLERREALRGLLFLSPWLIGFLVFTLLPTIATLVLSFTNLDLAKQVPFQFVGLKNYQDLLADPQVFDSLKVTFLFAVLWLPVTLVVPFVVALMLNSPKLRGASLFRVLIFLPYVVPFVAGVFIWQSMLLHDGGWLNDGPPRDRMDQPPELAGGPDVDLPGPGARGHLGHRRRRDHQPRPASRASRPSCTTRPRSTAPAGGASCAT